MEKAPPHPTEDISGRLGELLLLLARKDRAIYIDVYPVDPANPNDYTYEYWETSSDNRTTMDNFRGGTE